MSDDGLPSGIAGDENADNFTSLQGALDSPLVPGDLIDVTKIVAPRGSDLANLQNANGYYFDPVEPGDKGFSGAPVGLRMTLTVDDRSMAGYKPKILGNGARADGGFSLLELMIVVTIVGILASIALPSYQQYALGTKRADAHATLLRIATAQEKFFTVNNGYTTSTTALGFATDPAMSSDGFWAISITSADPTTSFTLTAAPAGGHVDATCGGITLTSAGVEGPAGCW